MTLYAAYGSNLDPQEMIGRAPSSPVRGTGWLEGWRLTFGGEDLGWEGALATVVEEPGSRVFVMLYECPTPTSNTRPVGGLGPRAVHQDPGRVQTLEGEVVAWLYVLDDYEGGLPSARYLGIVADAAEQAGAPADYVADLRTRPCRSIGP